MPWRFSPIALVLIIVVILGIGVTIALAAPKVQGKQGNVVELYLYDKDPGDSAYVMPTATEIASKCPQGLVRQVTFVPHGDGSEFNGVSGPATLVIVCEQGGEAS